MSRPLRIVALGPHHGAAIRAFVDDFATAGEPDIPAFFPPRDQPAAAMAADLAAWSRGERLAPGWVPCTTRFAERDGALLGVVNVRHAVDARLARFGGHVGYSVRPSARRAGVGHALLAAGLDILSSLGVEAAVLTCAPNNAGSIRIIEAAGGLRRDAYRHEEHARDVVRFDVPVPRQR